MIGRSNLYGWHDHFMNIAWVLGQNSPCNRKKVGAIIIKDGEILAGGYNTPFDETMPCECSESSETLDTVIHAEASAIAKLAKVDKCLSGCTMYVTLSPCITCANLILMSQAIDKLYYRASFSDSRGLELLKKNGVLCFQI